MHKMIIVCDIEIVDFEARFTLFIAVVFCVHTTYLVA